MGVLGDVFLFGETRRGDVVTLMNRLCPPSARLGRTGVDCESILHMKLKRSKSLKNAVTCAHERFYNLRSVGEHSCLLEATEVTIITFRVNPGLRKFALREERKLLTEEA